jgi:hypothetical protein
MVESPDNSSRHRLEALIHCDLVCPSRRYAVVLRVPLGEKIPGMLEMFHILPQFRNWPATLRPGNTLKFELCGKVLRARIVCRQGSSIYVAASEILAQAVLPIVASRRGVARNG